MPGHIYRGECPPPPPLNEAPVYYFCDFRKYSLDHKKNIKQVNYITNITLQS